MVKLKRIEDGKVFDCAIVLDCTVLRAVYYDNALSCWRGRLLDDFVPAVAGVDY